MLSLSIITINLNNSPGLHKTIESVIRQSFRNFEFIIIDGGSSDGSTDIIEEFSDKINYWVSEPDNGIYNAMNKGIKKAGGEYCLFLNSGDILTGPDILGKCFAHSYNEDILYGNAIFDEKGKHEINRMPVNVSFYDFYKSSIAHSCTFIKRELFSKIGFYNEDYKISSDWEFFLKAIFINKCTLRYLDLEIAVFNCEGISRTEIDSGIKERVMIMNDLFPRFIDDYDKLHDYITSIPVSSALATHIQFLNKTKRFRKVVTNIIGLLIYLYTFFSFNKYNSQKK